MLYLFISLFLIISFQGGTDGRAGILFVDWTRWNIPVWRKSVESIVVLPVWNFEPRWCMIGK